MKPRIIFKKSMKGKRDDILYELVLIFTTCMCFDFNSF